MARPPLHLPEHPTQWQLFKLHFRLAFEKAMDKATHDVARDLGGVVCTQKTHPEFYGSMDALAERAGVSYSPRLIVAKNLPGGPVWAKHLPNGGATPVGVVMISDAMMKLTGSSLDKPMSDKLAAVMAHEFSHLKDGVAHGLVTHLAPWALPVAAMAGLYLYDRAYANTPPLKEGGSREFHLALQNNIHKEADKAIAQAQEEESGIKQGGMALDAGWQARMLNAGRYLMAGAVGLAGGLVYARHAALDAEYRADAFAAKLVGPEAMKQVLVDLEGVFKEARKNKPKADTLWKRVAENYHWLVARTISAHPELEERLSHIDRVAERMGIALARL